MAKNTGGELTEEERQVLREGNLDPDTKVSAVQLAKVWVRGTAAELVSVTVRNVVGAVLGQETAEVLFDRHTNA